MRDGCVDVEGVMNDQKRQCQKGKNKAGSSQFRGVTKHRWTGKFEAHLWDSSVVRKTKGAKGRTRGKQVYLGGFSNEIEAAKAYDRAAVSYWGPTAILNFNVAEYESEREMLESMNKEEVVAMLRRSSTGFSRGASKFRGVTRHHQHGKWEARIGRVAGNKYLYLGTFDSEEAAAEAYDRAAIKFRGKRAVTNFAISRYRDEQIEISEESSDHQLESRPKRSRHLEDFKLEESDLHSEDARSEIWCRPSENPSSSQAASNEDLGPYGSMYEEGTSSELYTQLLMGNEGLCSDSKEGYLWDPYYGGFHSSSFAADPFRSIQPETTPCDASSSVVLGHPVFPEMGTPKQQETANNDGRSERKSQTGCFAQDAWSGIMEGIPGSEWANLLAGDWLQDSTTSAYDDILNNDN